MKQYLDTPMTDTIAQLKSQLKNLQDLFENGVIQQTPYAEAKAVLEQRIVQVVLAGPTAQTVPAATKSSEAKPANTMLLGLAIAVIAIAGAGYWWKGSPALASANGVTSTDPAATDSTEGNAPHTTSFDQIAAMTEKLSARLKEQPKDAEGWAMLARSYSVLGRHPEALAAYEKAIGLRKDDAMLLADYADSLAVKNGGKLNGEPMKQVDRALKLDPRNAKALFLAGTYSFDQKDYKQAVKHWQIAVQTGAANDPLTQQIESGLKEARQLAGLPLVAAEDVAVIPSVASVSGTVSLSGALAQQAQPEDTVFVFARAAQGARMPLAILRKQVKDLPLQFTLDDSLAMSPANALSGAKQVIVGARISKSGNAMPQPGDLLGQSASVAVGSSGLKIDIKDVVKP
jgi:cytochrome c-type biogenesis protein CcmH